MKNSNKEALPIGFTMGLAQDKIALNTYSKLSDEQKDKINAYINLSTTGKEAKQKINKVIEDLKNNNAN